ncbi:MAG: hypothetical protein V7708_17445 [Oceanicoccus sp.]
MKSNRQYHQVNWDFNKPNLDTIEAAVFLSCSPYTLRLSRSTGKLFGVTAPPYKKRGRTVAYSTESLKKWESQFEEVANTAQGAG